MYNGLNLMEIHKVLGHPGVTRLSHFVKTKNLPFSVSSPTHETEANEINPYAVARPQSTPNAPLNESQSSELREERSQQALPSNSRDENRSDLRRSTRMRKPPDRFGAYITH